MTKSANTLHTVPPFIMLKNLPKFANNPIPIIDQYVKSYGKTYRLHHQLGKTGFLSIEPSFIQHFMQKNHRNYKKSEVQTEKLAHYLGNGLLTSEGDYWLKQRRLIQPGFHRKRLASMVELIDGVIDQFTEELAAASKEQKQIDIYQKMMELTFHIIVRSLFSSDLGEDELDKISHNITAVQEFFIRQLRVPFLHPWYKVSGQIKKAEQKAEEMDYVLLNRIQERRKSGEKSDDLLQMLLDVRYEETGQGMTDKQILEESVILFVAGHETTANAMAWTWYLLAQHPESIEKIRMELDAIVGDRTPEFADLPKLEYTMQVIQESMRIYPPAWITDRVSIEEDEINGYHIPKNTLMIAYIYGLHHDPDIWENPEQFIPERFGKAQKKERHTLAYMPFGTGPRLCIGNNFALMEMQLIIAKMIRRFDFTLLQDQIIEAQPLITLRPKYGIQMKFWER